MTDWHQLATDLTTALNLGTPIAITFSDEAPAGVDPFDAPMPAPTADGRTGRVPAGCVLSTHAVDRTFDRRRGRRQLLGGQRDPRLRTLDEVAGNADVATLLDAGSRPGWCPRSRPCGRGRER